MEDQYNDANPSTLKPTQIRCTPGALNQLPPECFVEGDIRLAPFYDIKKAMAAVDSYIADMNADPSALSLEGHHGAHSKYVLADEGRQGKLELTWMSEGENGIACNLDSVGYAALLKATERVPGK